MLFYGYYDVQLVDFFDLWDCDLFDFEVQDILNGKVICVCGLSDDKGQLMIFIEVCCVWKVVIGELFGKIIIFFEGEEEFGLFLLILFMEENCDELIVDIVLICDIGMFDKDMFVICIMLCGFLGEEVVIKGLFKDLYLGMFGGFVINLICVLNWIIVGLYDDQGCVIVLGFYDGVFDLMDELCV